MPCCSLLIHLVEITIIIFKLRYYNIGHYDTMSKLLKAFTLLEITIQCRLALLSAWSKRSKAVAFIHKNQRTTVCIRRIFLPRQETFTQSNTGNILPSGTVHCVYFPWHDNKKIYGSKFGSHLSERGIWYTFCHYKELTFVVVLFLAYITLCRVSWLYNTILICM